MNNVAKTIAGLSPKKRAALASKLKQDPGEYGLFPLSFAQERLWFMDQLAPGNPNYNMPAGIHLSGKLNVDALEWSINEIMQRHDVLRAAFLMVGDAPMQLIMPVRPLALEVHDLSALDTAARASEAERLAMEEARQPFDLAAGYLLRARLLKLGEAEHRLLLVMHHIVSDDWSMGVLIRELSALYKSFSENTAHRLPAPAIQYTDFVQWQRQWLQGETFASALGYWRKKLANAPDLIELPTDRVRRPVQTFRGARVDFTLSADILRGLKQLGARHHATLFMTLFAAFNVLLHRYSGQTDLVVGTPIANRDKPELEDLIGLFFNTLALRTDIAGDPRFTELLARVRETALEAYAHQHLPFVKLVEALQPERGLSHNPLVQVMFILQNAPKQELDLHGLELGYSAIDNGTAQLDLILSLWEAHGALAGYAHFNTDLFEVDTIRRLLGHFETLLRGILLQPQARVSQLPIVTPSEQQRLTKEWNATRSPYPDALCLHQLFEAQAASAPDAVAAICGTQTLSYSQLDAHADRLAHQLRALGVGPDVVVGICVEHSFEILVGMLGILKAGGAYVPLDPGYPPERLAFMLNDAKVSVLLTQQRLAARLPQCTAKVICLDADGTQGAHPGAAVPPVTPDVQNLAYVIYTSGTTGRSKGVMIAHTGIVNNLVDLNRGFNITSSDRVLALSSSSFDMCVYETFGILAAGGTVVIPDAARMRDPAHWLELIQRHAVTVWNSAPALLQMLMSYIGGRPERYPRSLKTVILGGDWVPVTLPEQLQAMVPGIRVIVLGGATEASIHSIVYPVEATHPDWKSIPYGRPMANQTAYLLDAHMQPVPVGVPGELYLGGVGLARGYFARPDLTAERFLPHPFPHAPGERLYKTGDLARFGADGTIELIGRTDFQVKIRGHRIELGEIESVLKDHPAVKDAVVTARPDAAGEKRLIAYLVLKKSANTDADHLMVYLKTKLPSYMVPTATVMLAALPLSPNGKVDRKSLPAPEPQARSAFAAPETPLQQALAGAFARLTAAPRAGLHDNFFDLGGHSLKATQMISWLRDVFQIELPLRSFFEAPTVAELASVVAACAEEKNIDVQTIAQLYQQIEQLSESDLKAMLAEKDAGAQPGSAVNR